MKSRGKISIIFLAIVAVPILMAFFLVAPFRSFEEENPSPKQSAVMQDTQTSVHKSLQLETLIPVVVSPTPSISPTTPAPTGVACNHDNGVPAELNNGVPVDPNNLTCSCVAALVECKNKVCVKLYKSNDVPNPPASGCDAINLGISFGPGTSFQQAFNTVCHDPNLAPTDGVFCIGKPVIYLYPVSPTFVSVSIQTSGKIVVSDPQYNNGWKNIYAQPNGNLIYNNKLYAELFYESSIQTFLKPISGLTLTSNNLENQLNSILAKLGLKESERLEFIEFWTPKLQTLHSPFIQFSLIDQKTKNAIDQVIVNPQPDTRIEILVYFKPSPIPFLGPVLKLPSVPPQRNGFTMVEWGATIDNSKTLY